MHYPSNFEFTYLYNVTHLFCSYQASHNLLLPAQNDITLLSSSQSLNIPDRDPSGLAVGPDGLAIITTNLDIIVARDGAKVSSLSVGYHPCAVAYHPSQPEVVIGGKVGCGLCAEVGYSSLD